jgi:hypothetical protein
VARIREGSSAFFRLSPAEGHAGKGPAWYAIQRGSISRRIDAYSNQPHFRRLFAQIRQSGFRVATFSEISDRIFSGVTPLSKGDAYVVPPAGIRFLRSGEITVEGAVTAESDIHISEFIHNGMMKRSQLQRGDLLIAIVGATIGSAGIYDRDEPANINQAIAAVRIRSGDVAREFACWYLHSSLGQKLLDFFKRPVARANINLEEVGEIPLLVPGDTKQREMVAAMKKAQGARREKLTEADALLIGLDDFLLATLGLKTPAKDGRKFFAASVRAAREQSHLNADYFHPERILALRAMEAASKRVPCAKLEDVVVFIRDQIKTPGLNYLSLAHVQSNTGELTNTDEEAAGACSEYQTGDVLFARLRPYLNKVYRAEMDGCCSPEFHVLRVNNPNELLPDYLAAILRSSLTLAQTRHMMTGNTHPRLTNEDVINLVIPVPKDVAAQKAIAAEARRRREEARRLRAEAEAGWQAAKRWFEQQLLDPNKP